MATRTGGCSQPLSIEYFKKDTAATITATPAIAENSFTPTRLSQSNAGAGGGGGGAGGGDGGRVGGANGGDGGRGGGIEADGCTVLAAMAGLDAAAGAGTPGVAGGCGNGGRGSGGAGDEIGEAAGADAGAGAASRDRWVTRERSSSISFSCDSTTRRSVSSRRAVLRADTQAAIGRTKGMTSRISAKKRISTVPRSRAGGDPPGCDSLVAGVQPSYTDYAEPTSLVSSHYCRTPEAAGWT